MATIRDGKIVEDTWQHVADGEAAPEGDVIVTLARLRQEGEALRARAGKLGVRVGSDAIADEIGDEVKDLALVAIEFPKYVDGRGYTIARKLRDRFKFEGELRAVGNVLRDQLFYMHRCGFDAYELQEGKDAEGALEAFQEFSVTYQGGSDDPRPLYRRR
ncbi:MAG: DUF934 domain-containing protein [Myxococcales bacterium]|nr:DUF934 domain-containing protein [Myxococcales bacterium]